jgi:hypothetical protein
VAITGAWKARQSVEAGAAKQGTGINRVHWNANGGTGRNTAPGGAQAPLPTEITDSYSDEGYVGEYYCGDGSQAASQTGMADRPPFGTDTEQFRSSTDDYPEWGEYEAGIPGGTAIRSQNRGADRTVNARATPHGTATAGWQNKATGQVSVSAEPAVAQSFVNTSDVQLRKVRTGSQVAGPGRASEYNAPITQRIPGKIKRVFANFERHYDMRPQQQNEVIRPWWNRQAGTIDPALLNPNSMYVSDPITRDVPPDPYTGPTAGQLSASYGYQDEDMIPYA